jgi:hypothetical protein
VVNGPATKAIKAVDMDFDTLQTCFAHILGKIGLNLQILASFTKQG